MKITKRQLRRIIKEEKAKLLREGFWDDFMEDPADQADKEASGWIIDLVSENPGVHTSKSLAHDMYQDGFPGARVRDELEKLVRSGQVSQATDGTLSSGGALRQQLSSGGA